VDPQNSFERHAYLADAVLILPGRLRGGAHSGLNPRSGNRFA
jgi:hypothetical protein